jgi:hypothetical protein
MLGYMANYIATDVAVIPPLATSDLLQPFPFLQTLYQSALIASNFIFQNGDGINIETDTPEKIISTCKTQTVPLPGCPAKFGYPWLH